MKTYKLTLKKILNHFHVVNKHRWKVFCLCCKVGIPLQGLTHDLSKYLPVEFFETARYFGEGKYSPIRTCKEEKGYSMAWIHHKNHNKHHYEYWYDYNSRITSPPMPFKYFLELVCDSIAAGQTYQGKDWTNDYQLKYWNRVKEKAIISKEMEELITKVYTEIAEQGINKILKKYYLKDLYKEYIREN